MNQYEINQALKFLCKFLRDENYYAVTMYDPSITLEEAKDMIAQLPTIKEYLAAHPASKPLALKKRN